VIHKGRLAKEERLILVCLANISRTRKDRSSLPRINQSERERDFEEFPQRKLNDRKGNFTRNRRQIASIKTEETLEERQIKSETDRQETNFVVQRRSSDGEKREISIDLSALFDQFHGNTQKTRHLIEKTKMSNLNTRSLENTISPFIAATIEPVHCDEICAFVRL
jgi:hypothetical protein